MIGAGPEDVPASSWEDYLRSVRDSTAAAWLRAREGYLGLTKIQKDFQTTVASFTPDEFQKLLDTQEMVRLSTKAIDDALAGTRGVSVDANGDLALASLPADNTRIETRNDQPVMISTSTGDPVHGSGTVGLVWLLVGAGVIVTIAQVYTIKTLCDFFTQLAQVKAEREVIDLVKTGKATPEQASGILKSQADLATARGAAAAAAETAGWQGTLKTALYIGLGIAGLYVLLQSLPLLTMKHAAPAAA